MFDYALTAAELQALDPARLFRITTEPPTISANNATVLVAPGQVASNSGAFHDPDGCGDCLSLTASVGSVVQDPQNPGGWLWSFPTTGPSDAQTVTITANDNHGGIATTTFVLSITNSPPEAADDSASTSEDIAVNVTVLVNDTDMDNDADLRVAQLSDVRGGSAIVLADGRTIQFTPAADANDDNTPGGFGFSYTITDGTDTSANPAAVSISVSAVNDAPLAADDSASTSEDSAVNVTVLVNDTDVDNAHADLLIGQLSDVRGGSAVVLADRRTIQFTPAADANDDNTPGGFGFSYTVSDGMGTSAKASVTISVSAVNDAPAVEVHEDQSATIGYWQNKNGQKLILSLNGGATKTQLGNWLAATLPNMYGAYAGTNNLAGKSNEDVAIFYTSLFVRRSSVDGPPKVDAQALAVALAVYVTNSDLAGTTAVDYGFEVNTSGLGAATYDVGDANRAAFGLPPTGSTVMTVLDILLATNARTRNGRLYDLDGSGVISIHERSLRVMANRVFTGINERGDIKQF